MENLVQETAQTIAHGDLSTVIKLIVVAIIVYIGKNSVDIWRDRKIRKNQEEEVNPKLVRLLETKTEKEDRIVRALESLDTRMAEQHRALEDHHREMLTELRDHGEVEVNIMKMTLESATETMKEVKEQYQQIHELKKQLNKIKEHNEWLKVIKK